MADLPLGDLSEWTAALATAASVEDVAQVLGEIMASDAWASAEGADRRAVLVSVREVLQGPPPARELQQLVQCLAAGLLAPSEEFADHESYYLRSSLADLLNEWAEDGDEYPRADAVAAAVDAICDAQDPLPAIWFASAIGLRTDGLVEALLEVLAHGRDTLHRDAAASVLCELGLTHETRPAVAAHVAGRAEGAATTSLTFTLRALGDVPVALALYERDDAWPERGSEGLVSTYRPRFLGSVAGRTRLDSAAQGACWDAVLRRTATESEPRGQRVWLSVGPDLNDPRVVPELLTQVAHCADGDERWSLYRLLEACDLPVHLEAWDGDLPVPARATLEADATCPLGPAFDRSRESLRKGIAWHLLLVSGDTQAPGVLARSLGTAGAGWGDRDLCHLLACFDLDTLPGPLVGWLTREHDGPPGGLGADPSAWVRPRAAETVAGSSSSRQAFDALMAFGFTRDGHVDRSTCDLLSNAAQSRVLLGDVGVIQDLLDTFTSETGAYRHRVAASAAIERLAYVGALEDPHYERLLGTLPALAADEDHGGFWVGQALTALGVRARTQDELGGRAASALDAAVGGDRTGHGYWEALEALARARGLLAHPNVLRDEFGLVEQDGGWTVGSFGGWANSVRPFVFALAFVHDPEPLLPAALAVLREGEWQPVTELAGVAAWEVRAGRLGTCPPGFAEAYAGALASRVGGLTAFDDLRVLDPTGLATRDWSRTWSRWRPDRRAALADELGRCEGLGDTERAAAIGTLRLLAGDGTYEVRRSAYRAIAGLDPAALRHLCDAWLDPTAEVAVRKRGAEASAWLEPEAVHAEARARAEQDPEKAVRESVRRCIDERRGRELSRLYLPRVVEVTTNETGAMLAAWRYGEALARRGDDETLWRLDEAPPSGYLPPNVRHWRKRLRDAIEKRWKDVKGKWPKPWAECELPDA